MDAQVMSYEEAARAVTGPGAAFETVDVEIRGSSSRVFRGAPSSLRDLLGSCRRFGDQECLVFGEERWTYRQVFERADVLGGWLVDRAAVRRGDRVAIAMRNCPEWIVAYLAVVSVGAVCVPLNAWWKAAELEHGLSDSGARILIADEERVGRTEVTCRRLDITVLAVQLAGRASPGVGTSSTDETWAPSAGVTGWDEAVAHAGSISTVPIDADDDVMILYTSGTTGRPKGAVSTNRAVVHAVLSFSCRVAIDQLRHRLDAVDQAPPTALLSVPLFHVTGLVSATMNCLLAGGRLVMMYRWDPEDALRLIEQERATHVIGVPAQGFDLLQSPSFASFDTSSLVAVSGGGAQVPPALVEQIEARFSGAGPATGWGMTETNAYGVTNSGPDYLAHPASAGRGVPTVEIEARDEDGTSLPAGESGEIWFKGPNVMRGYWGRPEATAETLVDGWLRTGDVGRIDRDGFLYIEDRIKDIIIRGGENVHSVEVEAELHEHPDIYEVAVIGLPDERLGEEVAAVIYPRPGRTITVADVERHLADRLAAFKVPRHVMLEEQRLPRSDSGKILKRQLREKMLAELGSAPPAPVPTGIAASSGEGRPEQETAR